MGVPITFLESYNPNQFEILGQNSGRYEFDIHPSKRYKNPIQNNTDGSKTNGSKANTRSTIKQNIEPKSVYYTADNTEGFLTIVYARILVKQKLQLDKIQ